MRIRRLTIPWRSLQRQLCALIALVAYLTAAVGMPLPASTVKAGGLPFPCQSLLCGCETAEQCNMCGCFTPEQHSTWARTHGAEKPAESLQAVAPPAEKTDPEELAEKPCCCCKGKSADGAPMPCCRNKGRKSCCAAPKSDALAPQCPVVPRLALGALKCHGVASIWISAGAVPPSQPPLAYEPCMAPPGRTSQIDHFAITRLSRPLDPPPRPRCV